MSEHSLSEICPICNQNSLAGSEGRYECPQCGLKIKQPPLLGFLRKERYKVVDLGDDYPLARAALQGKTFSEPELGMLRQHIYTDDELAAFAGGDLTALRPAEGTLAQVIVRQLRETCYIQINDLRRALGPALEAGAAYRPAAIVSRSGFRWQDRGNLFVTEQRLVFPSNTFTFIRMDRKLTGVRAFKDAIAVQRKGEDQATYFVGCAPHQAALAAAYVQGKLPQFRR
ncbi:MAG: hypothetical protein ACE5H9_16375 [Anaerolineae bacterium]